MTGPKINTREGADVLFYARAVLADASQYSDADIRQACRTILEHSDADPDERDEARRMQRLARRAA